MSSGPKKDPAVELEQFEDALVQSILNMSETELRDEIREDGDDPDAVLREIDAQFADIKRKCAIQRLREAQNNIKAYRDGLTEFSDAERQSARDKISSKPANDIGPLLLAARKGKKASDRDLDSLTDDCAEVLRLEAMEDEPDSDSC